MQRNIFSPKINEEQFDGLGQVFYSAAQNILVLVFGLLPIFFVPQLHTTLGFMKSSFVISGVYLSLILLCLALLRSGKIKIHAPITIVLFWAFALGSVASALLSGDAYDSLYGNAFTTNTAAFYCLLAVVMTVSLSFIGAWSGVARVFLLLGCSSVVVYAAFFFRLIYGPEILSFGVFSSTAISLVGNLNDLALYAGLLLVVVMVTVHRLATSNFGMVFFLLLTVSSLAVLAVVNFSALWLVLGLLGLLSFLYLVAKDTWLKIPDVHMRNTVSRFSLVIVGIICIVSGVFIVGGESVGARMSVLSGINYLEVRPSLNATLEVTRGVYQHNAFLGVGPNRFEDAWRLFKDTSINDTQFWNTTFVAGSSLASTILVTTGILGGTLFVLFLGFFVYAGIRFFFLRTALEQEWYTVGKMAFVAAGYLWLMMFLYTPGAFIMLLTAVLTGLAIAISRTNQPTAGIKIDVVANRQYGFLLVAAAVVIIIASTTAFVAVTSQLLGNIEFNTAVEAYQTTLDDVAYDTALVTVSKRTAPQDIYPAERAQLRLLKLNSLVAIVDPTTEQQQQFEQLLAEGLPLAEQATALDPSNPFNYALLGSFYGLINPSLIEGIADRRQTAFENAKKLDPTNPEYDTLQAQITARFGDTTTAREYLQSALTLKRNYTDALYLTSQLDIQAGNATSAIAVTRSLINLEPNNPGRYFQLGLLFVATQQLDQAIAAFEQAVAINADYANARYMLALGYLDSSRKDEALAQLRYLLIANPDNENLLSIIAQIEQGEKNLPLVGSRAPLTEADSTTQEEDATVTNTAPNTTLVAPVNQVPATAGEETAAPSAAENPE